MIAAASLQPGYAARGADPEPDAAELFDDSDGAYTVVEPDPFAGPGTGQGSSAPRRVSLRAELGSAICHFAPGLARPSLDPHSAPATRLSGTTGLLRPALPPLPVPPSLAELLPGGLRRGSTIAVNGSVSLLLTLLGAASGHGAWTALVGMPPISAEAAVEAGLDLERLAMITPLDGNWTSASWTTAVGALLDALDLVVARPAAIGTRHGVADGDSRRLAARARSKDAVLVLFGQSSESWPAVELKLSAEHGGWTGIGDGYGRLVRRRLIVTATGRGRSSRPRTTELLL